MSHYEKLKALKMGQASDFYTALYARSIGGAKEYERYISGELPLILSDSVGKPLVNWSVIGNTVQDGEPTPEQPIEVKGVGDYDAVTGKYKIPVVTRGKNLWNPSTTRYEYAVDSDQKVVNYSGGAMYFLKAETGKYTFKANDDIPIVRFGCTSEPFTVGVVLRNLVEYKTGYAKDAEITIDNIGTYLVVQVAGSYANTHDLSVIQIELGSTATEYEPYIEPITTPIYLNSQLMADEVLKSDGSREVEWGKWVITGDENFYAYGTGTNKRVLTQLLDNLAKYNSITYSSHFQCTKSPLKGILIGGGIGRTELWLVDYLGEEIALDSAKLKQYFKSEYDAGHPVTVWYQLAEPTSETVDVPTIPTLEGNCVLDVDTEVQPTNMSVTYKSRR